MLKKNKTLDLIEPMNFASGKNKKSIKNYDDMIMLIDRLSNLFKNYINQAKINISENREIFSFIEKKANQVQIIVKNIINHNYNLEQLKALELSINKIKEKNNYNNLNVFNDEQNLSIFLEETNILFKTIKQKYLLKIENLAKNRNITSPIINKNGQNNIISPKSDFNELTEINKGNNYYLDKKKRTFSSDNKKNLINEINMIPNKQKMPNYKSTRNRNKQLDKEDLINVNIPSKKAFTKYDLDIQNEAVLNNKNESKFNNQNFRNIIKKNESNIMNDTSTSSSVNNEKKLDHLSKEVLYYKNLVKILSNNKNINLNANKQIGNNDYKLLLEKLKIQEKEIMSKNKKIKILCQEIIKNKNQMNNMNYKYNQSEAGVNLNLTYNLKNSDNEDNLQKFKTESNLSNEIQISNNNNKKKGINGNEILNYINRIKYLEKENSILKSKLNKLNIELSKKTQSFEKEKILFKKEIKELKNQIKIEINKNEELNNKNQEQNIKYEIELSKINDKRIELSKFLSNKNTEIISLQKELNIKEKDLEKYKEINDKSKIVKNNQEGRTDGDINLYYKNIINEKEAKELQLNNEINKLNEKNNNLLNQLKIKTKENTELSKCIKNLEIEISQKNEEINNKNKGINDSKNKNNINTENSNDYEMKIKILKEENEGLKQFTLKQKKLFIENEKKDEIISLLQKEKEALKQYFINMNVPLPTQQKLNDSIKRASSKNKTFESKFTEEECFNILMQLNDAKKEISILKKKNEELLNDLDNKHLKNDYFNHISIEKPLSNYEEEFDLKKMAKGVQEKNRSQDINIDYPGTQQIKEKYRELDFYYNSLEDLVKKMLLSSTCTNKNKTYMNELCKIVGFDDEMTYKILNNKVKKGILYMFG